MRIGDGGLAYSSSAAASERRSVRCDAEGVVEEGAGARVEATEGGSEIDIEGDGAAADGGKGETAGGA
jgi:hypothetical protein